MEIGVEEKEGDRARQKRIDFCLGGLHIYILYRVSDERVSSYDVNWSKHK